MSDAGEALEDLAEREHLSSDMGQWILTGNKPHSMCLEYLKESHWLKGLSWGRKMKSESLCVTI